MRNSEPILNIKQKKRSRKPKRNYLLADERKKHDPDYEPKKEINWKPLDEMTDEEYDKFKKNTCQSILKRKKRSPRFNKYQK